MTDKIYKDLEKNSFYVNNDEGTFILKFICSDPDSNSGYAYFYDNEGNEHSKLNFTLIDSKLHMKNQDNDYGLWIITKANEIYPVDGDIVPFKSKK